MQGEDKTFAVFRGILLIRSHDCHRIGGDRVYDYANPIPIERTTKQFAASAVIRTTTDRAAAVV